MTTRTRILQELGQLSGEAQAEVLRLVEALAKGAKSNGAPTNPFGLWADLGVNLSADDIDQARREAWGGFPREDIV